MTLIRVEKIVGKGANAVIFFYRHTDRQIDSAKTTYIHPPSMDAGKGGIKISGMFQVNFLIRDKSNKCSRNDFNKGRKDCRKRSQCWLPTFI